MNKSLLIFGVSGFVGKYLAEEFYKNGYEIYGSDVIRSVSVPDYVKFTECDLLDSDKVSKLIDNIKPTHIIKLFYIKYYSNVYNTKHQKVGTIYGGTYYSGCYDPKYPGYVKINYKSGYVLINKTCVSEQKRAKILQTGSIGQYGGNIIGYSACGPASATILINSQFNEKWNKDNLILYSERHYLNDQGSLRNGSGGMTAPKLIKLINSYSNNKYKAKNIFGTNGSNILKSQIDKGNRAIVVVQYTSYITTTYNSGTHFVVICGYEYINGQLYFYYADPYFGNGSRGLMRVSKRILQTSMNMVVREPRCIITVHK